MPAPARWKAKPASPPAAETPRPKATPRRHLPATVSRRPRTTNASSRASSLFPTLSNAAEPTTAINKTQASPERPRHAPTASMSRTFSRTGGAAVLGLQQSMERDVRKRTVSASSALSSEAREAGTSSDADRVATRPRASLDSNSGTNVTRTTARERRGTVTSLFSRT